MVRAHALCVALPFSPSVAAGEIAICLEGHGQTTMKRSDDCRLIAGFSLGPLTVAEDRISHNRRMISASFPPKLRCKLGSE